MPGVDEEPLSYDKEQYDKWKSLTPIIYDWFTNHNLTWPSQSCRWGRVKEEHKFKRRQLIYLSEQTTGNARNTLQIMTADVVKPRVAAGEVIRAFNESNKSPYIKRQQTIYHPGEVNKIREVPSHESILVTHTDAAELFVWSLERQPDRAHDKGASKTADSKADIVLTGHDDIAEFALGLSSAEPMVASGGRDTNVLVWKLSDHVTSLTAIGGMPSTSFPQTQLAAQTKLQGHTSTIEDVVFKPNSATQLASVGDDKRLLLWDTRSGTQPATKMGAAHGVHDIHTVDWCKLRDHHIATGAADGTVKVWDSRSLGGNRATALYTFAVHTEAVMHVEWCPHRSGGLASSGEDRLVHVWDLDQKRSLDTGPESKRARVQLPQELMLTHAGHRAPVVDFQWNPHDPWTMMSVSDEAQLEGGGTLQLWRVSDLLHRSEEDVLAELEKHREFIVTGRMPEKMPSETPTGAGPQGKVDAAAQVTKASAAGATNAPKDAKADSPVNKDAPLSPQAAEVANAAVVADAAEQAKSEEPEAMNIDPPAPPTTT